MNRIYNVIWSKTKKCYVVVSEIVKTGGGKVKSVQSGTKRYNLGTHECDYGGIRIINGW